MVSSLLDNVEFDTPREYSYGNIQQAWSSAGSTGLGIVIQVSRAYR